jgi:adenylate kinase
VLFGAPGVGKGTYGKLMYKHLGYPTFSMGDYFRNVINHADDHEGEDPEITKLREILRSGQFVDDKTAINVIKHARNVDYKDTPVMLIDGMPRTVAQAKMLPEFGINIDIVFNFFNTDSILMEKLMGRRVCPSCGKNYNVADIDRDGYKMGPLLPKKNNLECDNCPGVKLVIRDDDKENIIKERLEIYKEKTVPILDYYQDQPETKVIDFEAKRGVDDFPELRDILIEHTKHF